MINTLKHRERLKMNKQIYELNKAELLKVLNDEMQLVTLNKKYKEIKKIAFLLQAVNLLDENITVKIEGVRKNNESRQMVNAGSLIECIVKHYRNGYESTWKTFNDNESDLKNGFMNWEIKASLPNARNTALTEPKNLILVNTCGVFIIKKSVSMELMVDSNNKYYENMDYSAFDGVKHYKKMEKALGIIA